MKKAVEFLLLAIFGMSLFSLIIAPIEIYKTIDARSWDAVEITITTHQIKEMQSHLYPDIRIVDEERGEQSQSVSVRFGDAPWTVAAFGGWFKSSLKDDLARYPSGLRMIAYRNPDGSSYVLEQNSVRTMVSLMLLACIYPAVAIWSIATKRSRSPSESRS